MRALLMNALKKIILMGCCLGMILSTQAETRYAPDDRAQLPAALDNSYFGMGAGYTNIPFSNKNLINGFQATSFTNPTFGLNIFIGHYVNPYLATEISLMRPIKWAYANGIAIPGDKHSVWISLFGISLRPTLPITPRFSAYGLAGVGIISRHGFNIGASNTNAIPSEDIATLLTGGGVTYALTPAWHLNVGLEYALARPEEHQPHMLYAYGGFYYLFHKLNLPDYYSDNYIFHKNLIRFGTFSTDYFNPNVAKYFTVGYLPIFWTGDLKIKNGDSIMYEKNVFHTHKYFSLDVGASASTYSSQINNTSFQAFSVFPEIRVWLMRSHLMDFYFMYSVAGPSYLTRSNIDGINLGGRFTFQDLLGFGLFIGKDKHLNINAEIGHYSNGNLLPNNPGAQVPLMFSLGYAF